MILQIVFLMEFSNLPKDLEHFADSNDTPWNQPTIFQPSQTPKNFAEGPCHFGSQADFVISVFWEVTINTVLP